jgi:hypothetical protein
MSPQGCQFCLEGTYAPYDGMSECVPCPAGFFGFGTGLSQCEPCEEGFVSAQGQTQCTQCPIGQTTICVGAQQCVDASLFAGSCDTKPDENTTMAILGTMIGIFVSITVFAVLFARKS